MDQLNAMLAQEDGHLALAAEDFRSLSAIHKKMTREKLQAKQQAIQTKAIMDIRVNPRAFYRLLRSPQLRPPPGSLQDWCEHGQQLYHSKDPIHDRPATLSKYHGGNVFTEAMITKALAHLKNNKAADSYMVRGEYLKVLADSKFSRIMAQLFNQLLQRGEFPRTWTQAEAQPLHKNGNMLVKDNYRYIMITAILYKLYATTVNHQITPYLNQDSQFFQAGFRKRHSCAHHLFITRVLIEQAVQSKEPLFACFVDLKKAFDTVPRHLLWEAYGRAKIPMQWIRAAQLMYLETPVRIRQAAFLIEMFLSNMGVRQGCPHSPTTFAIYMQQLHQLILDKADSLDLPQLMTIVILLLLFADDIALFSRTAAGLQRLLDIMDRFCEMTHMLLNTKKTIIVVFNPREKTSIPFIGEGWSCRGNCPQYIWERYYVQPESFTRPYRTE